MSLDSLIHRSSEFTVQAELDGNHFTSKLFNKGSLVVEFRSKMVEADALIPSTDGNSELMATLPFKLPVTEGYRFADEHVFSAFDDETSHQLASLATMVHEGYPVLDEFAEEGMSGMQQFITKFGEFPPKIDDSIAAKSLECEVTVLVSAANFHEDADYTHESIQVEEGDLGLFLKGIEAKSSELSFGSVSEKAKSSIVHAEESSSPIRTLKGADLEIASNFMKAQPSPSVVSEVKRGISSRAPRMQ